MRWGFMGASTIADRVIPPLCRLPGQLLLGVCSRSAGRARQCALTLGLALAGLASAASATRQVFH